MKIKVIILDCHNLSLERLLNSKYISQLEKTFFDKYKDETTKIEKVVSAYLKNKYIGSYYLSESGKPLSNDKYFNISHSGLLVTLIIDKYPIGVDIEKIRPVKEELIDYVTNVEEKKYVHDEETFFEIWTNKEALVKSLGIGIKQKPNNIPALPINGLRQYEGKTYINKTVKYKDYIISTSRQSNEDYSLEIEEVNLDE